MSEASNNDALIPTWPADWPNRQIVDLDHLGDPGAWIDQQLPEVADVLFDDPSGDLAHAEFLTEQYIIYLQQNLAALPTDFGGPYEDKYAAMVEDFTGFIREWRLRALAK